MSPDVFHPVDHQSRERNDTLHRLPLCTPPSSMFLHTYIRWGYSHIVLDRISSPFCTNWSNNHLLWTSRARMRSYRQRAVWRFCDHSVFRSAVGPTRAILDKRNNREFCARRCAVMKVMDAPQKWFHFPWMRIGRQGLCYALWFELRVLGVNRCGNHSTTAFRCWECNEYDWASVRSYGQFCCYQFILKRTSMPEFILARSIQFSSEWIRMVN